MNESKIVEINVKYNVIKIENSNNTANDNY